MDNLLSSIDFEFFFFSIMAGAAMGHIFGRVVYSFHRRRRNKWQALNDSVQEGMSLIASGLSADKSLNWRKSEVDALFQRLCTTVNDSVAAKQSGFKVIITLEPFRRGLYIVKMDNNMCYSRHLLNIKLEEEEV